MEKLSNRDWLNREYVLKKRSFNDIAKETFSTIVGVRHRAIDFDLPIRKKAIDIAKEKLSDQAWLNNEYNIKGLSLTQIGKNLKVNGLLVRKYFDKHGIVLRSRCANLSENDIDNLDNRDWLNNQYIIKNRSSNDIAKELLIDPTPLLLD